jgi:hypothetical protein
MLGHSSEPGFHAVYWRCAAVFFYSSKIFNPAARHILFTNVTEAALQGRHIDGVALTDICSALAIEIVTRPITYRLPRGTFAAWGNQFYILDIIDWLALQPGDAPCLVLDSDCVWRKSGAKLFDDIAAGNALSYALDNSRDGINNGVTNSQLAEIWRLWRGTSIGDTLTYTGGETFAATLGFCRQILDDVHDLWCWTLDRVTRKEKTFPHEEAHFLTLIYAAHSILPGGLNPYLKRIWTGIRTRNVVQDDANLTIWHLPWEKRFGIRRLYRRLFHSIAATRPTYGGAAFQSLVSVECGVPKRGPAKFARDLAQRITEKLGLRP